MHSPFKNLVSSKLKHVVVHRFHHLQKTLELKDTESFKKIVRINLINQSNIIFSVWQEISMKVYTYMPLVIQKFVTCNSKHATIRGFYLDHLQKRLKANIP